MALRTYADVLSRVEGLAGVSDGFTTAEQTKVLGFVNDRLEQAYEASPVWPRYYETGEARPATDGVITVTYDEASGVRTGSSATRSGTTVTIVCTAALDVVGGMQVVISGLTGTDNPNGTFTIASISKTTVDNDTLTYDLQTNTTNVETYTGTATVTPVAVGDIGDFYRVFDNDPVAISSPQEYEFLVQSDGAEVIGIGKTYFDVTTGWWVSYKKPWDGPYEADSVAIPGEFFLYAVRGAYADFLRMDAQNEKAMAEENRAEQYLALEVEKAANVANSRRYSRISTHLSRQARYA